MSPVEYEGGCVESYGEAQDTARVGVTDSSSEMLGSVEVEALCLSVAFSLSDEAQELIRSYEAPRSSFRQHLADVSLNSEVSAPLTTLDNRYGGTELKKLPQRASSTSPRQDSIRFIRS